MCSPLSPHVITPFNDNGGALSACRDPQPHCDHTTENRHLSDALHQPAPWMWNADSPEAQDNERSTKRKGVRER